MKVLVSRYRPESGELIEKKADYFVQREYTLNPIFPLEISMFKFCSDAYLRIDDCRLWLNSRTRGLVRLSKDKVSFLIRINFSLLWMKVFQMGMKFFWK